MPKAKEMEELHDGHPAAQDHSSHPSRQKICTHITPIPLPADDCDRVHSMHAALSSLHAATASFDAAMDSLSTTTAHHLCRVKKLECRMAKVRECLCRLDDLESSKAKDGELDDRVVVLFCPGSYEEALKGMELELAKAREELNSSNNHQKEHATKAPLLDDIIASNSAARSAADATVQEALLHDVQMDNGQAVPSDAWLDHASMGLGVGRTLKEMNYQRSVPLLLGEDIGRGEAEYRRTLDALVLNASMTKQEGFERLESLEESMLGGGAYGGRGDDESVYSMTSQMSSMSVSSSTRMTAGQRRRWHKQQQMQKAGRSKASSATQVLSPHPEAPSRTTTFAVAGRQQSLAGSHPHLCEVFHDSYGIGPQPPKGLVDCSGFSAGRTREGGTGFYPPTSHVADLLVFNTVRSSYGPAKSSATALMTAKLGKGGGEEKGKGPRGGAGCTASSAPAGRKSQSSGGGGEKPSLANLVFKADTTEGKATGPSLNLPASLPNELESY